MDPVSHHSAQVDHEGQHCPAHATPTLNSQLFLPCGSPGLLGLPGTYTVSTFQNCKDQINIACHHLALMFVFQHKYCCVLLCKIYRTMWLHKRANFQMWVEWKQDGIAAAWWLWGSNSKQVLTEIFQYLEAEQLIAGLSQHGVRAPTTEFLWLERTSWYHLVHPSCSHRVS